MDTVKQLAKSNVKIGFRPGSYMRHFFHGSSDPEYQKIARKIDSQDKEYIVELGMCDPEILTFFDATLVKIAVDFEYTGNFGKSKQSESNYIN